ncbi:semaphorin-4D isoform X1 [Nannospalax galili]|uniref:semaphorin-4D isoform X1 n=1 Tax=Nannospalax galili TaxID=1026970 RepID=UPI0004ED2EC1|nr:semaphorin-4D isoform X1 [Nannospalax galili]XP_008852811.1 semaphorin-4D isoform X1 [Nannospalax galili]XP_008852812.1 semaphorin-4D isoform X1 [Nannospalax galili]XP_017659111.1 semaphorin-4D isoform X1 [Nannospalax galili]
MRAPIWGLLLALTVLLEMAVAFAPVPRITWEHGEVGLLQFHEPGTFNYSALLMSEDEDTLYVGAREAVFAVNALNVSEKQHEVYWKVSEDKKAKCAEKGKSKQTECLNYIRVLQPLSATSLYVCGTNAFQPTCDHLNLTSFKFLGKNEDGKGRCPFDPAHSYTSVMVGGELYSGTSYNFLGSEPIISRNSSHSPLRTEYAIPWLNEPSFVFADVIQKSLDSTEGEDDRVYFFFTEVSVEYEFVFKLMIPRVARVCKGDQGGLRTLQKKWTSFLKARLICSRPDSGLVFNILQDVFVLRAPGLKEPVFYALFTPQLNNVGLSAVCAYALTSVEAVFARGKYMQSATVEQSHTKWVRYNGPVPTPRPGACIDSEARAANYTSSLNLPDKTLQFVKDHPLMDDSVTPIGNRPRLIKKGVNYTQIVVDRTQVLDGTFYDVMFISTDQGALHKAVILGNEVHVVEETQLFQDSEPVQTLLLSSKKQGRRFVYAGSNSGVVQSPLAFCGKHSSCEDCVLARDPYCAWNPATMACITLYQAEGPSRGWIQEMSGDTSSCPDKSKESFRKHFFKHGGTAELKCFQNSNLARVVWKFQNGLLKAESPKYGLVGRKHLLIFNLSEGDSGVYQCLSEERVRNKTVSQLLAKHVLEMKVVPQTPMLPTLLAVHTEGSRITSKVPVAFTQGSSSPTPILQATSPRGITPSPKYSSTGTSREPKIVINTFPQLHSKTVYLKSSDNRLLMSLFLFIFVLFLCLFSYNCYKGYLPGQCLKFRSALLLGKKKPKSEFSDLEQSVKETLVEPGSFSQQNGEQPKPALDTGYETEQDTITSKVPTDREDSQRIDELSARDKPFDVKCELKFADSDADGD